MSNANATKNQFKSQLHKGSPEFKKKQGDTGGQSGEKKKGLVKVKSKSKLNSSSKEFRLTETPKENLVQNSTLHSRKQSVPIVSLSKPPEVTEAPKTKLSAIIESSVPKLNKESRPFTKNPKEGKGKGKKSNLSTNSRLFYVKAAQNNRLESP